MGLFGIFAHGMCDTFEMEKALIGLVACEAERHTAVNITRWTEAALKGIGLTVKDLLGNNDADGLAGVVASATRKHLDQAALDRLGISAENAQPDEFIFKKVSDNGANIKSAWNNDDGKWAPCIDHTIELCTLPFTWIEKRKNQPDIAKGSVAESFSKGRGIVGYLHVSPNALSDFHDCQKRVGLPEEQIELDVKTRWRTAHNMADQLVFHKSAVQEMDTKPAYKDPGETWGKNKLSFENWDHLEESSACLMEAAVGSQLPEGDKYPTSPLVVPTVFRLITYSAASEDVFVRNRDEDEFNDPVLNPVMIPHNSLNSKVKECREKYHTDLIDRFDSDLPVSVKKFWYVATTLDPRFKNLTFDGDKMIKAHHKRDAIKWLTEEYNKTYKHKVYDPATAPSPAAAADPYADSSGADGSETPQPHKRRKVSSASFFAPRAPAATAAAAPAPVPSSSEKKKPYSDELKAYLALPQIDNTGEWSGVEWWKDNAELFPNLAVMARQYFGCPASSASVERLFSHVGIAFSKKRRRANSDQIANIIFTKMNVP